MRDLDKALSDILAIRSQIAAGTAFCGYGPAAMAGTGVIALAATLLQAFALPQTATAPLPFFLVWLAAAAGAAVLTGAEMVARSHRHHSGLADAMIHQAVEQFLPAAIVGVAVFVVLLRCAPDTLWLVPGLWQVLMGIGIFASLRSLPRTIGVSAAFYVVAGVVTLILASETRSLSPWTMGLPFVLGQSLTALILRVATEPTDG
jgi:hypothetical protein